MWPFIKETVVAFLDDEALSRGAAIAFYTATSIAPILLIVIAIAGLVFGQEAAQGAILSQLKGLMGQQAADTLQTAIASASSQSSGVLATVIGVGTLLATASGVFGEMQVALNKIWKAEPKTGTVSRLVRARAASVGLVAALGFLLLISLAVSAGLTALGDYLDARLPFGQTILAVLNFAISLVLLGVLFAAIYKVLPDRNIAWRDVIFGAGVTAVLFTVGKSLIGWYLGSSAVASTYGAAGGLIVLLFWIYYSTQVFLLGAEITKVRSLHGGRLEFEKDPSQANPDAAATRAGNAIPRASAAAKERSSLDQVEAQAARTRQALVDTVSELEARLSPGHLKAEAKRRLRYNVQEHPGRTAAALFGVALATGLAVKFAWRSSADENELWSRENM